MQFFLIYSLLRMVNMLIVQEKAAIQAMKWFSKMNLESLHLYNSLAHYHIGEARVGNHLFRVLVQCIKCKIAAFLLLKFIVSFIVCLVHWMRQEKKIVCDCLLKLVSCCMWRMRPNFLHLNVWNWVKSQSCIKKFHKLWFLKKINWGRIMCFEAVVRIPPHNVFMSLGADGKCE